MLEAAVPYCALILAAVFGWAAVSKAFGWPRWRTVVGRYHLGAAATPVALVTPVAELGLVALLLVGPARLAGIACIGAVAIFSLSVLRARGLHGDRVPCGCFGGSKERDFRSMLLRNGVLAVLGAVMAIAGPDGTAFMGGDA